MEECLCRQAESSKSRMQERERGGETEGEPTDPPCERRKGTSSAKGVAVRVGFCHGSANSEKVRMQLSVSPCGVFKVDNASKGDEIYPYCAVALPTATRHGCRPLSGAKSSIEERRNLEREGEERPKEEL